MSAPTPATLTEAVGALPLLRHIILRDDKSSTYKLGLLRALCRAADGSAGLATEERNYISLPLGIVAMNWLRLYLPLLKADLPQVPPNLDGRERLGFVKEPTRALMLVMTPTIDLRIGQQFSAETGRLLHTALASVVNTITNMPAKFMKHEDGSPVVQIVRKRAPLPRNSLILKASYLAAFGVIRVPRDLWLVLQHLAVWIEPTLIEEWKRLTRSYAQRRTSTPIDEVTLANAMVWTEPVRARSEPSAIALRLLASGQELYCIWSGRRLSAQTLDVDHCLPWAVWPCSDLWNLLPAHRKVNQHDKRDRLPSKGALLGARDAILSWWSSAYLGDGETALAARFEQEARASLPGTNGGGRFLDLSQFFDAVDAQRQRLLHDQQVPEWDCRRPIAG